MRILVFGGRSLLGRAFVGAPPAGAHLRVAHHTALEHPDLMDGVDVVVNFARHPDDMHLPHDPARSVDIRLARHAAAAGAHYIMLSSRKVYAADAQWQASEDAGLSGLDTYGRNKLATEMALRRMLPADRLTILRLGNVIGHEHMPGRRSFMGLILNTLADTGEIVFDMSPFVSRDFVTAEHFAAQLGRAVELGLTGTYNLSSGTGVMCGELALAVIRGYGRGQLRVIDPRQADAFRLDVSRLVNKTGLRQTADDILRYCHDLGKALG
ncbi:sugar nucleotide-binding protein [Tistrella mobilis]|uniref:NAD-dependent epimerase/dehydratase family protein n=1 Tax=Tistrella mobilis TaxID=171437 RepID=UPI003558A959